MNDSKRELRRRLILSMVLLAAAVVVASAMLFFVENSVTKWLIFAGAAITAVPLAMSVTQLSVQLGRHDQQHPKGEDAAPEG